MPDILLKRQWLETPNDSKGHSTVIKENHKIKTRQIKNKQNNKEQGINGNKGQEKKQMIMDKKTKYHKKIVRRLKRIKDTPEILKILM